MDAGSLVWEEKWEKGVGGLSCLGSASLSSERSSRMEGLDPKEPEVGGGERVRRVGV